MGFISRLAISPGIHRPDTGLPVVRFKPGILTGQREIVLIDRDLFRLAVLAYAVERGAERLVVGGGRIVGVIREHHEERTADSGVALLHRHAQVGIAGGDDAILIGGVHHQVKLGRRLEKRTKIGDGRKLGLRLGKAHLERGEGGSA